MTTFENIVVALLTILTMLSLLTAWKAWVFGMRHLNRYCLLKHRYNGLRSCTKYPLERATTMLETVMSIRPDLCDSPMLREVKGEIGLVLYDIEQQFLEEK